MNQSIRSRVSVLAAALLVLGSGVAFAQTPDEEFANIEKTAAPSTAQGGVKSGSQDIPVLELDTNFKLIGAKATLWLTLGETRQKLGVLQQKGLGNILDDAYAFRRDEKSEPLARLNWKDATFDLGGKILCEVGPANIEVGRVRQRIAFSLGTGLDVYRKGEQPIGYVDNKVGKTLLEGLLLNPILHGKYYSFQKITRSVKKVQKQKGLFKKTSYEVEEVVEEKTELFRYVGTSLAKLGPAGVFCTPDGKPILIVKGDWWASKNIFDFKVRREDSDGAGGKAAKIGGTILIGVLAGGDEAAKFAAEQKARENDWVRNSSAYLGSFLIGLVYFPEFRETVGVNLPNLPNF